MIVVAMTTALTTRLHHLLSFKHIKNPVLEFRTFDSMEISLKLTTPFRFKLTTYSA